MAISAKEVTLLLVGLVSFVLLDIFFKWQPFDFNNLQVSDLMILFFVSIASVVVVVYLKINEVNEELDFYKSKQKQMGEKIKIYEQLIDVKPEINHLKNMAK